MNKCNYKWSQFAFKEIKFKMTAWRTRTYVISFFPSYTIFMNHDESTKY